MLNRRPRRLMNQMNVVPYIDVMLVLLVIFMVTTPMFTPGVIDVPRASEAKPLERQDEAPVFLEIKSLQDIRYKDGKQSDSLSQDQLSDWARQYADGNRPLVVSAEKNMSYNDVVQVVNALQKAGVKRVALVVEKQK